MAENKMSRRTIIGQPLTSSSSPARRNGGGGKRYVRGTEPAPSLMNHYTGHRGNINSLGKKINI